MLCSSSSSSSSSKSSTSLQSTPAWIGALFGWLIQPDSTSHNSIFLSREISQPFSQQYFPLTRNQPASQPNKAWIALHCGDSACSYY